MDAAALDVLANGLVARFSRMVRRDGGALHLISVEGDLLRIGYRPGADPDCADGVCVLPGSELETMMSELLAAQAPQLRVRVERTAA